MFLLFRYKFKPINVTTSTILLFDLQNDPFETTNLAENRAEIIANMVAHINQEIEEKFPPQSVAIYAMLMKIFEEFKKSKHFVSFFFSSYIHFFFLSLSNCDF